MQAPIPSRTPPVPLPVHLLLHLAPVREAPLPSPPATECVAPEALEAHDTEASRLSLGAHGDDTLLQDPGGAHTPSAKPD